MRLLLLLLPLLLTACPTKSPTSNSTAAPAPSPSAAPASPSAGMASPTQDFAGVWTTTDDQGQVFDILIFSNGQTVTTSTKSKAGAQGKQGFWRKEGNRLLAFYNDGTSNIISPDGQGGFRSQNVAPDASLDASPITSVPILAATGPMAKFVGIWQLNKEPGGDYLYIALQSNGRAFSSINGGTEGKWTATETGAECTWPDGWVDRIERSNQGWQKRSWIGTSSDAPTDLSPAFRLGETRFNTVPEPSSSQP